MLECESISNLKVIALHLSLQFGQTLIQRTIKYAIMGNTNSKDNVMLHAILGN